MKSSIAELRINNNIELLRLQIDRIESMLRRLLMTDSEKAEFLKPLDDDIPKRHCGVELDAIDNEIEHLNEKRHDLLFVKKAS
jgi:chromosome segregation ATPase